MYSVVVQYECAVWWYSVNVVWWYSMNVQCGGTV